MVFARYQRLGTQEPIGTGIPSPPQSHWESYGKMILLLDYSKSIDSFYTHFNSACLHSQIFTKCITGEVLYPWALFARQQCLSVCFYFIGIIDEQVHAVLSRLVLLIAEVKHNTPGLWQLMAALYRWEAGQRHCHPMGKTRIKFFTTTYRMTDDHYNSTPLVWGLHELTPVSNGSVVCVQDKAQCFKGGWN